MWLKRYATALVKYQWGQNLSKFGGIALAEWYLNLIT